MYKIQQMKGDNDYIRIATLIAKEVIGELSLTEQVELNSWLNEDAGNKRLYDKIRNSSEFNSWLEKYHNINIVSGWGKIVPVISKRKRQLVFHTLLKYAAIILFPIIIGGGILYLLKPFQDGISETPHQAAEIKPGSTKAVLILSDGKSIILDSLQRVQIEEENGILIHKEEGTLDYSQNAQSKKDELIYNTINIPHGGEYSLVLSDGTQVFLNSMSNFKYPVNFIGQAREVELTGEAYFIVSKDVKKPFIVKTNHVNIEVLGTSFNVNAYEKSGKVVTTLVEGKVNIQSGKNSGNHILVPDEQAVFNVETGAININKVDVSMYTEWRNGQLTFYNERLEDIMIILTRWYSANVIYLNPSVKNIRFSGNLDRYGDIRQILDIIQSTNKLNVEINNGTILFDEKK